jgi:Tol biopolymer transport system component
LNNPDYSKANRKIVFSARNGPDMRYPHHIYTIDAQKNLTQLTNASEMDFDCSWSEDGTKVVFSRVPLPALTKPSQVWLMDSDGTNLEKITDGGPNPNNESPQNGVYPIGIDADPDLRPDNKKIVVSRLKTAKQNLFGIYELIIVDVDTKKVEILDSNYANMVPEWKSEGILFLRQIGSSKPMEVKQSLYLYKDGKFEELEKYPYNVFPIGAYGGSWIE